MKVLYVRISSLDQKTDRQRVQESEFNLVIEDKVSGSVPFFERQGGKMVLDLVEKGEIEELSVFQIDRLGRDVRDIVNTIHFFTERKICISFISQGLKTLNPDKSENSISKMVINILGIVSEIERTQILERQRQGIDLAKSKGVYKGRQSGTKEDTLKFLSKPKNKKVIEFLRKGYKSKEISLLVGIHINTITKIKKHQVKVS
jgi:DNA invertase Pin-like site-specific DNA recombinase